MLKVVEATNVSTNSKNNYKTKEKNQRLLAQRSNLPSFSCHSCRDSCGPRCPGVPQYEKVTDGCGKIKIKPWNEANLSMAGVLFGP